MKHTATQGAKMRLVKDKLQLARRFRDLTIEQQTLIRKLPAENALARVYALVDERQRCIDEYNQLSRAEAELGSDSSRYLDDVQGLDKVLGDLQAVLAEAAAVDAANVAALEREKDGLMEQLRQIRQGKQVLEAYGRQGSADASFLDKSK